MAAGVGYASVASTSHAGVAAGTVYASAELRSAVATHADTNSYDEWPVTASSSDTKRFQLVSFR